MPVAHLFLYELDGRCVDLWAAGLLAEDSKPLLALLTAVGLCDTMAHWQDLYRKEEDEYRSNPLWEANGICRYARTDGKAIDPLARLPAR